MTGSILELGNRADMPLRSILDGTEILPALAGAAPVALAADTLRGLEGESVTLPAGLGWDHSVLDLTDLVLFRRPGGPAVCRTAASPAAAFATRSPYAGWPVYWVDRAAGSDANAGTTAAAPFLSIHKAISAANAAGTPAIVKIKAGTYERPRGFSNSNAVSPQQDMVFVAYGGRVVTGPFDSLTWARDATYGNCFTATRSNTGRVFDLVALDGFGHYTELSQVADAATCNAHPGTWALVGSTLYVHRADAVAVSDANTRAYLSNVDNFAHRGSTQKNFAFLGESAGDGFDLEGGYQGALVLNYTAAWATPGIVTAAGATFRYAGTAANPADNVAIQSKAGLVFFADCDASKATKDGFNIHNSYSGAALRAVALHCSGFDNGRGASTSNNTWTVHEDIVALDLAGIYGRCRGAGVHIIGASRLACIGTASADSLGDIVNGGTAPPSEFRAENSAQLWLDRCPLPWEGAGRIFLQAEGTAAIRTRGMEPLRGAKRALGAAVIETY
ncbi:hypothetical protein [Segnochrobactrum spirostomi]|uniref:DUF1565 domain-containing protein n=1 Tax=Segnochrobactrum spirostomi TaxID=2608987 RepID=A0A6A7Y3K0_9HYPH|nr:hypothetical protein [Segnochrobactrum spirostomi]MQT12312.1 hypothetical protein [Segnochrobactrum spirostomi]